MSNCPIVLEFEPFVGLFTCEGHRILYDRCVRTQFFGLMFFFPNISKSSGFWPPMFAFKSPPNMVHCLLRVSVLVSSCFYILLLDVYFLKYIFWWTMWGSGPSQDRLDNNKLITAIPVWTIGGVWLQSKEKRLLWKPNVSKLPLSVSFLWLSFPQNKSVALNILEANRHG
jgi:hypothetical protein